MGEHLGSREDAAVHAGPLEGVIVRDCHCYRGGPLGWDARPNLLHSWKPCSAAWQQLAGLRWGFLNGTCGLGRSADQAIPFTEARGSPDRLFRGH